MKDLICPYCGNIGEDSSLYAWREGGFVKPIIGNTDHKGFSVLAFECRECDREFFVDEGEFYWFKNHQESEHVQGKTEAEMKYDEYVREKTDIIKKFPHIEMPCCKGVTIDDLRNMPVFKYHKYHIEVYGHHSIAEFLQDMAFDFGYRWIASGQDYTESDFKYLTLEPETKILFYCLDKPSFPGKIIDLHGYIQLLNGVEPQKKPEEINHFSEACQHGGYPREEWRLEVTERNTQLGYWEWVDHRIEADDE
jgi:hypothetical protein